MYNGKKAESVIFNDDDTDDDEDTEGDMADLGVDLEVSLTKADAAALLGQWLNHRKQQFGAWMKIASIADAFVLTAFRTLPKVLHDGIKKRLEYILKEAGRLARFEPARLLLHMLYEGNQTSMPGQVQEFLRNNEKIIRAMVYAIDRWHDEEEARKRDAEKKETGALTVIFGAADALITNPLAKKLQELADELHPVEEPKKSSITTLNDVELLSTEPGDEEILQDARLADMISNKAAMERYLRALYNLRPEDDIELLKNQLEIFFEKANSIHEKRLEYLYPAEPETQEKLKWHAGVQAAKSYEELWKILMHPESIEDGKKIETMSEGEKKILRKRIRKETILKLAYCTLAARVIKSREYKLRTPIAAYLSEFILSQHVQNQKYKYVDVYFRAVGNDIEISETWKEGFEEIRLVECDLIGEDIVTGEKLGPIPVYFYPGKDENNSGTDENGSAFDVINIKAVETVALKALFKKEHHPQNIQDRFRATVFAKRKEDWPMLQRILDNGILNPPNRIRGKRDANRVTSKKYDRHARHGTVEIDINKQRLQDACKRHKVKKPQYLANVWLEVRDAVQGILLERCAEVDPSHGLYKMIQMLGESKESMPSNLYRDHWLLVCFQGLEKAYHDCEIQRGSIMARAVGILRTGDFSELIESLFMNHFPKPPKNPPDS